MEIKTYANHFCGCGGACYGLEQAGLECMFAIDYLDVAVEYRKKNLGHQAELGDITQYVHKKSDAADLLWTSPPCQTFSTSAREQAVAKKKLNQKDKRDALFLTSLEYCIEFKPKFFVLENVMGLLTHNADGFGGGTLQNMIAAFSGIGYDVEWNVLKSTDFGLPQKRERVFIIGARKELKLSGLIPNDGSDPMGFPTRTPPTFGTIMQKGIREKAWGHPTYRTALAKAKRTGIDITVVMPEDLLPTITCGWGGGATRKKVAIADIVKEWNPHPSLGPGAHISEPTSQTPFLRHPTVLEGARAQGFPDSWEWPDSETNAWTLIGNAVSSPVSKAIGEHLIALSRGERPKAKTVLPAKRIAEYVKAFRGGDEVPAINFG
jgi:DNA (cytosine-5)-methyltransferase 1